MRKPPNIVYGVDEAPPFGVTVLSGFQHVGLISIFLLYPLLVSREGSLSVEQTSNALSLTMLILGTGAILQSLPRGAPWEPATCVRLSALQRIWTPHCWRSRWAEWRLCSA